MFGMRMASRGGGVAAAAMVQREGEGNMSERIIAEPPAASSRLPAPRRRRGRGKPFARGHSGNPAGRPAGSRNKATLAAETLLDGEAEELMRLAVARARAGSDAALKLCLDRILAPRRERAVRFAIPALDSPADLAAVMRAVIVAVAEGVLTPAEALELSHSAQTLMNAIEHSDFEERLLAVEKDHASRP